MFNYAPRFAHHIVAELWPW